MSAELPVMGRDPAAAGRRLILRWAEPHRRYHDLAHLNAVLDGVDALAAHATDPDAVRLAAWYHDAVYTGAPDDEERSAQLAEAELGPDGLALPAALVSETARLVRLTLTHNPAPGDRNGETLCDADLAILAADSTAYLRYTAAVRAEYAHVEDAAFRAGRASLLTKLLGLPSLFRTARGKELWESPARDNVAAELTALLVLNAGDDRF